jgi:hypothetical protein
MAIGYRWIVVTADRRRLAELEDVFIEGTGQGHKSYAGSGDSRPRRVHGIACC